MSIWNPPKARCVFMTSGPGEITTLEVTQVFIEGKSRFQSYAVIETRPFGRTLVLDGQLQSSSYDEWVYHESLVHPSMCAVTDPKRVAVLGGGEGATLREVLRYPSVESAIMVDIDGEVVDACKRYLPEHHCGAFDDPRVTFIAKDARVWLSDQERDAFDVIIIDLTEPLAGGPSCKLFTREFYEIVRHRLKPSGVMSLQAGPVRPDLVWAFARVLCTIEDVFRYVVPYTAWVTSFAEQWGFALAGQVREVSRLTPSSMQESLDKIGFTPKFLDGEAWNGLRSNPKYLRVAIDDAQEVVTDADPIALMR